MITLGIGGVKPCVSSFGAHQFDNSDLTERVKQPICKLNKHTASVHMKIKTMPLKFYNLCRTQPHTCITRSIFTHEPPGQVAWKPPTRRSMAAVAHSCHSQHCRSCLAALAGPQRTPWIPDATPCAKPQQQIHLSITSL
jgi:hypothetical protein